MEVATIDLANPVVISDGPFIEFVGPFVDIAGPFIEFVGPFIENVGLFIEIMGPFIENVGPFIDIVGPFIEFVGPFAISTVAKVDCVPLTTGNQHQRSAKPQTNCHSLCLTLDSTCNTT